MKLSSFEKENRELENPLNKQLRIDKKKDPKSEALEKE
jgi:hypothetical protein